jgi:iron-sulfur cluster assembly accessory protein
LSTTAASTNRRLEKGSEIDFVDELAGAEFRIRNPNARSSCGCGVSFSI